MEIEKNGIKIKAKLHEVGKDLLVVISGGDKPHIGACVMGNKDEVKITHLKEHKDHIALNLIAEKLRKKSNKNICVLGGIHVENINKKQIKQVLKMSKEIAKKIRKNYL